MPRPELIQLRRLVQLRSSGSGATRTLPDSAGVATCDTSDGPVYILQLVEALSLSALLSLGMSLGLER